MTLNSYIENIAKRYALGNATEHTFRGDLQHLLEELIPEIAATNEPKRIECGAPDYVLTRKDIPVGYIEAKDIPTDLESKSLKEQFDRYRNALDNLAFTDYLDFHFYASGTLTAKIKIGEIQNGKILPLPQNFEHFTNLLKAFCSRSTVTIKSSKRLAEMMAEKAKILAYIIKNALEEDIANEVESELTNQLKAFKDILIHDIDPKAFADIYAQTIAYGMFAARLHDPTLETFSRQEAAELIPKTNPFLRKLFQFIATFDLDTRIDWIVDALADLFRATDIAAILKNFGRSTQTHDPIMHFYETFLAEYDPKLRKSRGVFYTPEPVVDFIVRAVDDILKSEFNLPAGLADTTKTKIKVDVQGKLREQEVHKVQILDPATGTGTFLASVIKHIYKRFEGQQGIWGDYVDNHLITRLNGFELLMASYAMAHLKLDLLLTETGYTSAKDKRFQVYLTNALEEYHPDTGTLFASWLSSEANEANHIKRDTPVMVVIGNPPYSVSSSNKSEWIENLTADYKKDLNERNVSPLSDDYIKFIRLGQHFVDKNGEGILAFISNNSFIDGLVHRQMRKHLLESFDEIYILDLHGSSNKNEKSPDGTIDKNVFDIMQGVSINIFIKKPRKLAKSTTSSCGTVFHSDLFGTREHKYRELLSNSLQSVDWQTLKLRDGENFFAAKDFSESTTYDTFLHLNELFVERGSGIKFRKDNLLVRHHFTQADVMQMLDDLEKLTDSQIKIKYALTDTPDWKLEEKRKLFLKPSIEAISTVSYRPFELRYAYYPTDTISKIIVRGDSRVGLMKHLLFKDNLAILLPRQALTEKFGFFLTNTLCDINYTGVAGQYGAGLVFPLYLYPDNSSQQTLDGKSTRVPNLNSKIVEKIAAAVGLTFTTEKEVTDGTFAPIDILDYIYAVLHSPSYREKYKEFLKIDFPRVPYPKDAATFWELAALGGELRQIHLLESSKVEQFITRFPVGGDNVVAKAAFLSVSPAVAGGAFGAAEEKTPSVTADGTDKTGRVQFSQTQYFEGVPEIAWNFYIGGYQPAQKWLKDRKGRTLNYDDIQHYQKIIVALTETDRIMKEIDKIEL